MKKPCVFQRDRKLMDILYRENYPLFAERQVRAEHLSVIFLWRLESIFFFVRLHILCASDILPTTNLLYTAQFLYHVHHLNSQAPFRCTLSNMTNVCHLRNLLANDGKCEEVRGKSST